MSPDTGLTPFKGNWPYVGLILAYASVSALDLWSRNAARSPSVVNLVVLTLALFGFGFAIFSLLRLLGNSGRRSTTVVAVLVLWVSLGGSIGRGLPTSTSRIAAIALAISMILAAWLWGDVKSVIQFVSVAAVINVVIPVASGITTIARLGQSAVEFSADVSLAQLDTQPNILFLVLDGYPRSDILMERFGFDNEPFIRKLQQRGFTINDGAKANYTMTYASLASVLSMQYVLGEGVLMGNETRTKLYDIVQSGGTVGASLQEAGYRYIHVESGWGGSRCGPEVDVCVDAPFLDETSWAWLDRSILSGLLRRWNGHTFPHSALDRLETLSTMVGDDISTPSFVFGHILAPHPPNLLDEECGVRYGAIMSRMNIGVPFDEDNNRIRRQAFVEEIACLNRRVLALIDQIADETIVIITGDHGSDSLGQLLTPVSDWSDLQVAERLGILLAVRASPGCRIRAEEISSLINLFPVVSRCLTHRPWPILEDKHILVPVEENFPRDETMETSTTSIDG